MGPGWLQDERVGRDRVAGRDQGEERARHQSGADGGGVLGRRQAHRGARRGRQPAAVARQEQALRQAGHGGARRARRGRQLVPGVRARRRSPADARRRRHDEAVGPAATQVAARRASGPREPRAHHDVRLQPRRQAAADVHERAAGRGDGQRRGVCARRGGARRHDGRRLLAQGRARLQRRGADVARGDQPDRGGLRRRLGARAV
mmetsp:Transcript_24253/g.84257  ORF Transcript_24253/g.84257 Transcript_24253/m.84257 type:complete len:205 (-) Transcript_24253:131-745(-)